MGVWFGNYTCGFLNEFRGFWYFIFESIGLVFFFAHNSREKSGLSKLVLSAKF